MSFWADFGRESEKTFILKNFSDFRRKSEQLFHFEILIGLSQRKSDRTFTLVVLLGT